MLSKGEETSLMVQKVCAAVHEAIKAGLEDPFTLVAPDVEAMQDVLARVKGVCSCILALLDPVNGDVQDVQSFQNLTSKGHNMETTLKSLLNGSGKYGYYSTLQEDAIKKAASNELCKPVFNKAMLFLTAADEDATAITADALHETVQRLPELGQQMRAGATDKGAGDEVGETFEKPSLVNLGFY